MAFSPPPRSADRRQLVTPVPTSARPKYRGPPRSTRVQFAGCEYQTPSVCCCCGVSDPTESYSAGFRPDAAVADEETDGGWNFPLCAACQQWMSVANTIPSGRPYLIPAGGAVGCALFAWYLASASPHQPTPEQNSTELVWILFGVAAALVGFAVLSYGSHTSRVDRLTNRARNLKPGPACVLEPVVYLGQRGEGVEFVFTNPGFTDEIVRLNSARVVR